MYSDQVVQLNYSLQDGYVNMHLPYQTESQSGAAKRVSNIPSLLRRPSEFWCLDTWGKSALHTRSDETQINKSEHYARVKQGACPEKAGLTLFPLYLLV